MSEDASTKLDTAYCDANRAKAAHIKQVHSQFSFMEKKEGGAGVQLPTAVCAAATAFTLYWSLNSRNTNFRHTTEAIWHCWQQREDDEHYTPPRILHQRHCSTDPSTAGADGKERAISTGMATEEDTERVDPYA
jgi:hypothetical protein